MAQSVSSNGIMIEDRADTGAMVTMRFTASQLHRMLGKDGLSRMDFSGEPEAVIVKMADLIVRHRRSNGGIPGISDGGMHVGKHDIKAFELGPMVAAIGMRPDEISEPQVNIVGPSVVPVVGMSSLRRLAAAITFATNGRL